MKGTSTQPDLGLVRRSFQGYRSRLHDLFGDRPTRLLVIFVQREHSAARWILRERPWQELEALLPGLQVEEVLGGNAFVAWGVKP
jgi:hypothetical protein